MYDKFYRGENKYLKKLYVYVFYKNFQMEIILREYPTISVRT